jgi:hypothetical protein
MVDRQGRDGAVQVTIRDGRIRVGDHERPTSLRCILGDEDGFVVEMRDSNVGSMNETLDDVRHPPAESNLSKSRASIPYTYMPRNPRLTLER